MSSPAEETILPSFIGYSSGCRSATGIITVVVGPTVLENGTPGFRPKARVSEAPLMPFTATAFVIALAYLRFTAWVDAGGSLFEAGLSREFADGAIFLSNVRGSQGTSSPLSTAPISPGA